MGLGKRGEKGPLKGYALPVFELRENDNELGPDDLRSSHGRQGQQHENERPEVIQGCCWPAGGGATTTDGASPEL